MQAQGTHTKNCAQRTQLTIAVCIELVIDSHLEIVRRLHVREAKEISRNKKQEEGISFA